MFELFAQICIKLHTHYCKTNTNNHGCYSDLVVFQPTLPSYKRNCTVYAASENKGK